MLRWNRWCVIWLVLLVAGCASVPDTTPIDDGSARALYEQGDFRAAAAQYQALARANRGARDRLLLAAAEALREEGDFAAVDEVLDRVQRKRLAPGEAARLDLLLAESALARGDAADALSLATLPDANLDPAGQARAGEVRARALDALGRPLDALSERVGQVARVPRGERAVLESEIIEGLAGTDAAQLQQALSGFDARDPRRPYLERALRLKGVAPVRNLPRPTRQAGTLLPDAVDGAWQAEGQAAAGDQVALLLPLSGPLAAAGAAVRDGFLATHFAESGARPTVRVFDSGADAASALAAYRRAVQGGADRVVGPLARDQVGAVLAAAEGAVPVLALNHAEDGSVPPAGSQQFGLLPDDEAALAAEHALSRGLRNAVVLAATEDWAERAALAFRAQFEQGGGAIAAEARLAPTSVDVSPDIGRAVAAAPDVVFLALRPQLARLIVPQLRAAGLTAVQVLATSHVYGGSPSRALDRDLNGVEFCDAPWLFGFATGLPPRDALAASLGSAQTNPRLLAFGMDAYRLLPYLDWLARNPDAYLPGASGQLALDPFGRVRRLLTWMRFVDGTPRAADSVVVEEPPAPAAAP